MRAKANLISVLLLLLAALVAGCGTRSVDLSKSSSQLDFGVKMAKTDLWREALFRFERAVEIDPENASALNNLAVAYEGIGEFEKARDIYARALRVDRSNQYIQKNYSRFVEFYSRNKKREQATVSAGAAPAEGEAAEEEADEAEAAEAEEPSDSGIPVEASRPEEPPKPGPVPTSDLPPDPEPPVPDQPPPGGAS